MGPKASTSSPLGPLAKRTFKGSSISSALPVALSASGVGGSSGIGPAGPSSSSRGSSPIGPSASASASTSPSSNQPSRCHSSKTRPVSPPLLLPRSQETSLHRRLRSLLIEFVRLRRIWEDEVVEMAEAIGSYATVLGDLEEELAEYDQRRRTGRKSGGEGGGGDKGQVRRSAKAISGAGRRGHPEEMDMDFSSPAIPEAFRSLDGIYTRSLTKGQERIQRATEGMIRCKDSARSLQVEWIRLRFEAGLGAGCDGEEVDDVRWGRRGGDEFVEAISHMTLQVQIQSLELLESLDRLLVDCSPLGPLHIMSDYNVINGDTASSTDRRRYDPSTSSSMRKAILILWRDLPTLDRGGEGSFEWWEDVWRFEVRGWEEI